MISDNYADKNVAKNSYGIELKEIENIKDQDALVFAVAHKNYLELTNSDIVKMIKPGGVIMDLKSIFALNRFKNLKIRHWRL